MILGLVLLSVLELIPARKPAESLIRSEVAFLRRYLQAKMHQHQQKHASAHVSMLPFKRHFIIWNDLEILQRA